MIWRFGPTPGTSHLAASCDDVEEWERVMALDEVFFDGQRAHLVRDQCDRETLWLRFLLDEPFRMPPLVLHFEDPEVAACIVATGWYTHEDGLYLARHGVMPGDVKLDRVFAAEPPPTWEGRSMPGGVEQTQECRR